MTDRPQRPDQKPELAASTTPVGIVLDLVQKKNVELTPREIAEIVWLGVRWSEFDISAPESVIAPSPLLVLEDNISSEQRDSEECQTSSEEMEEAFQGEADEKGAEEQAEDRLPDDGETEPPSKTGSWQRTRINLPQLPVLDNPLAVSRALHRLARTREAPGRPVLNVPLTVRKTASSGIYQLVLEPAKERSSHLIVLIDIAAQLAPWHKTFEQFLALIEEIRSFASLEVLEMDLRSADSALFRRAANGAEIPLGEAARPGMDHLVLVLSDGVGSAVSSGALGQALSGLPAGSHVAWLHPWPRRQWHKTRIGRLRTVLPGLISHRTIGTSTLGVPVVPLTAGGLLALERWVQGLGQGRLLAQGIPKELSRRRERVEPERREIDWAERARRLVGVLEPSSLRLLTLAAAIPGRVDIELLRSLGQAFGVTTTGYSLAEAMTAGFLECTEKTADRRVVMRFANEEARRSLLQYIERDEVPRVLDFLINSYGPGTAAEADVHFGRQHLQLPLDVLTHTLHPEKAGDLDSQALRADREREGFGAMASLIELAYPGYKSSGLEDLVTDNQLMNNIEGQPYMNPYKRKLIEVALPLDAINKASAYEKMPGIGPHPRGLHLWWARRPLAAARAVIFAQMVDDPSAHPDLFPTEKAQEKERQRLFRIIESLVLWENTTNETVLQQARDEIWQSWRYACAQNADHPQAKELFDRHKLPGFHDPFAGGGALPLEAQRLGLESYASDLNPVAVLINKAMIEIPPMFADKPPVNPEARQKKTLFTRKWRGAQGLAEDVCHYGKWMRDEAEKRIGHLYPKAKITEETVKERQDLKKYLGQELTVIAWLWARTVKSPNPAFAHVDVPLVSTFMLSTKEGKEAYVEPVIENGGYRFTVKVGKPKDANIAKNGTKLSRGANFQCLMSRTPISSDHIKAEGKAGRMGTRLMAVVAEGERGRVYLSSTKEMETVAHRAKPEWKPDGFLVEDARAFTPTLYGLTEWGDLFTNRQLVALTTFSDLVQDARQRIRRDAVAAGLREDGEPFAGGEISATAYADAVGTYLAFAVDRCADFSNSCTRWVPGNQKVMNLFGKQAIGMTWDFPEAAILHETVGGFTPAAEFIAECIKKLPLIGHGNASQQDAASSVLAGAKVVSTDPPYYDNVPYADLSDFFYVWLRRSLRSTFPNLFTTLTVPKAEELVATRYRHGSKEKAESFFLAGMTQAMHRLAEQVHPAFPVTIYYAFKQAENDGAEGTASTGWETFLDAVIRAGFSITGTWPMRSEQEFRMRGINSNALASSIVLVCRPRVDNAPIGTRRDFVISLKTNLPEALAHLQHGNIAPVDLAQAAIGPGMAVYTRYAKVLDAEGKPLSVREALALINQTLDEVLAEQESDFDAESRFALAWFGDHGFEQGPFGDAHTYFLRFNTAENALKSAGIIKSGRGDVRLLRPSELAPDWDPAKDKRLTAWEVVHQLIHALEADGESAAAGLAAKLGSKAEIARELAYRLYTLCERKKRAAEALSYNGLVQSWPEIMRLSREGAKLSPRQTTMFQGSEE